MAKSSQRRKSAEDLPELAIVGNGMVSASLCEKLVSKGAGKRYSISVFGEEPRPAYDRVRLSNYVLNRDPVRLELLSAEWYQENGVSLQTGDKVESISPETRQIETKSGVIHSFDHLVLATGSSPFLPPIDGISNENVFVYRTIEDMSAICDAAKTAKSAAVLGGGLLGLEAAQALQYLEVPKIHVVELANFLMPQQLNEEASEALIQSIGETGFELHLGQRANAIDSGKDGLTLELSSEEKLDVDLIVVAAGIRPRSELAKDAGIHLGGRGGIGINDRLETSADEIYAIGECAEHDNRIYGLAAPGFQMAEVLAERLCGSKKASFKGADTSTRLKMLGVDVLTLGNPLQPGATTVYQEEKTYRHITTDGKGRLSGALVVGPWAEAGQVQTAIQQKRRIRPNRLKDFASTGQLWSNSDNTSPTTWPDKTIICNCIQVRKGILCDAIDTGTRDVDRLCAMTGAGSVCGSCRPLIAELAGEVVTDKKPALSSKLLLWISAVAIVLATTIFLVPEPPVAQSVTSFWYNVEFIWRDFVTKQITGYSLMGLSALGLVMSLRKRIKWFKLGDFLNWRAIHSAFGLISLVALFAHTGFRFGDNLNFWLMFVFVLLNLLGAFAGVIASLEVRGTGKTAIYARRLRPSLTWAHIILFWPFPILLGFHILSVYLY
ncbi:MAG: FAD-dependent oxidoreductase [Verrucomicrobiota bacterium]